MSSSNTPFDLTGRRVAILATDGFEESELIEPLEALEEAGAEPVVVSLPDSAKRGTIRGWSDGEWGSTVDVNVSIEGLAADDFQALVLPGGVMNPDKLRMNEDAVAFVSAFFEASKPVAAICHGPWMIAEAGAADGRTLTSYPSIRTDLENAGATWVDEPVVVDQGLVTSRHPGDMEAFIDKMLEEIHEGRHAEATA